MRIAPCSTGWAVAPSCWYWNWAPAAPGCWQVVDYWSGLETAKTIRRVAPNLRGAPFAPVTDCCWKKDCCWKASLAPGKACCWRERFAPATDCSRKRVQTGSLWSLTVGSAWKRQAIVCSSALKAPTKKSSWRGWSGSGPTAAGSWSCHWEIVQRRPCPG